MALSTVHHDSSQTYDDFGPVRIASEREGEIVTLCNLEPLAEAWTSTIQALAHFAESAPDRPFLCERKAGAWRRKSFAQVFASVRDLAGRLVTLGCTGDRPLVILAGNSVLHAELSLAAQFIGVPVVPISPAYSTGSDFDRLRTMLAIVEPGAVLFPETARFAGAIAATADLGNGIVPEASAGSTARALSQTVPADPAVVAQLYAAVGPDTVAKLLFTSGSTGKPKAVINTQRMLCANQTMLRQIWPVLTKKPPVMVDWLPWSHTFGGNFTFGLALFNGGSYYIDAGKPTPVDVATTITNVAEVGPDIYFNVPAGYEAMLALLDRDQAQAARVFGNMKFMFCAGAALPQSTRDGIDALARETTGRAIPIFSGWGSTETAPCATATWFETSVAANIGVPLPGVRLRLVPDGSKAELRVAGPTVTPGYWKSSEATRAAFDEDGYYRMGDAGKLIDPAKPELGILFDGRVSENFKLTTGTWVSVGALRLSLVNSGRPLISDIAITGHDRDEIGALIFLNHAACREFIGDWGATEAELARHPLVVEGIAACVAKHNSASRGSSTRVCRFGLLEDGPQPGRYEITDKGYLNQRAVLEQRQDRVVALYSDWGHCV